MLRVNFDRIREGKEQEGKGALVKGESEPWEAWVLTKKIHLFNSTLDLQNTFPPTSVALGKVAATREKGLWVCNLRIPC